MKKYIITIFLVSIASALCAQVGEKMLLRLKYSVASKEYLTGQHINDLFTVDVGINHTVYYSHIEWLRDSVKNKLTREGYEKTALAFELNERGFVQGAKNGIIRDIPGKSMIEYDKIGTKFFNYKSEIFEWNWDILEDTLSVLGYLCYKAKAEYAGRVWIAWFCPQIASDCGPWKLYGLPGLILKAYDSQRHYTFDCVEMTKSGKQVDLSLFNKGREIKENDFVKMRNQFKRNPLMFIENQSGIKVVSIGGNGPGVDRSKYVNLKYNPIERE